VITTIQLNTNNLFRPNRIQQECLADVYIVSQKNPPEVI